MEDTGGGGGAIGKLWRKLGRGFYALMGVGTFIYLEVMALASSIGAADTVQQFMVSELATFAVESLVNTAAAMFWPVTWFIKMGLPGIYWAVGGYALWVVILAIILDRREKRLLKEIDL